MKILLKILFVCMLIFVIFSILNNLFWHIKFGEKAPVENRAGIWTLVGEYRLPLDYIVVDSKGENIIGIGYFSPNSPSRTFSLDTLKKRIKIKDNGKFKDDKFRYPDIFSGNFSRDARSLKGTYKEERGGGKVSFADFIGLKCPYERSNSSAEVKPPELTMNGNIIKTFSIKENITYKGFKKESVIISDNFKKIFKSMGIKTSETSPDIRFTLNLVGRPLGAKYKNPKTSYSAYLYTGGEYKGSLTIFYKNKLLKKYSIDERIEPPYQLTREHESDFDRYKDPKYASFPTYTVDVITLKSLTNIISNKVLLHCIYTGTLRNTAEKWIVDSDDNKMILDLIEILSDNSYNSIIRSYSAILLSKRRPVSDDVIKYLIIILNNKKEDFRLRYFAIAGLKNILEQDKSIVPSIISSLKDEYDFIRYSALQLLNFSGNEYKNERIEALKQAKKNEDNQYVKYEINRVIKKIEGKN